MTILNSIKNLPCWNEPITIHPLEGGTVNQSYLVEDGNNKFVVKERQDRPNLGLLSYNEYVAQTAAQSLSIAPRLNYSDDHFFVTDYIEGKIFNKDDLKNQKNYNKIVYLLKKIHSDLTSHVKTPVINFWGFQTIRSYLSFLSDKKTWLEVDFDELTKISADLEEVVGPTYLTFIHNDLGASNIIQDSQSKIWILDWEYSGFGSVLIDLAGLSICNDFTYQDEVRLLENYFDHPISSLLWSKYSAMKAAIYLRDALWAAISDIELTKAFDFKSFSEKRFNQFNEAYGDLTTKKAA